MSGDETRDAIGAPIGRSGTDAQIASARVLAAAPRTAMLALVPLAVIVLGFITPPVIPRWLWPYRSHVLLISPYEDGASVMWSIQLVALVLGVITLVHAGRRSEPGLVSRIVATIGTLVVLLLPAVMLFALGGVAWSITLVSAVVVIATLAALVQAFRARGWLGWLWVLAAYAIAALPYACPLWPGIFDELSGGVTFVAGDLTLLVLALRGVRGSSSRDQQRR